MNRLERMRPRSSPSPPMNLPEGSCCSKRTGDDYRQSWAAARASASIVSGNHGGPHGTCTIEVGTLLREIDHVVERLSPICGIIQLNSEVPDHMFERGDRRHRLDPEFADGGIGRGKPNSPPTRERWRYLLCLRESADRRPTWWRSTQPRETEVPMPFREGGSIDSALATIVEPGVDKSTPMTSSARCGSTPCSEQSRYGGLACSGISNDDHRSPINKLHATGMQHTSSPQSEEQREYVALQQNRAEVIRVI